MAEEDLTGIPPAQLGWMAGVIDLKGRIIRKKNKLRATPQLVLAVESAQLSVIKELGRLTGTSPEISRPAGFKDGWDRRGCAEHCPDEHVHVAGWAMPAASRWTITGMAMGVVLWNLSPLLRNDERGLLDAMNEALEGGMLIGRGSSATVTAVSRLQLLGWRLPPIVYIKMVRGHEHVQTDGDGG